MRVNYNLVSWKQTPCLKYSTPLCYTTQGGLWPGRPCWVHTLMTLWLGLSPMCADQVKNRHQCREVALKNTIKNMHLIMFSPFVFWWILITEIFPSAILCFYNYFSSCYNCHGHFIWDALFIVHWSLTADMRCCLQFYPVCPVFILHA